MEISEKQIDHYFSEKWFELTNMGKIKFEEINQRVLGISRKPIVIQCTSSISPMIDWSDTCALVTGFEHNRELATFYVKVKPLDGFKTRLFHLVAHVENGLILTTGRFSCVGFGLEVIEDIIYLVPLPQPIAPA